MASSTSSFLLRRNLPTEHATFVTPYKAFRRRLLRTYRVRLPWHVHPALFDERVVTNQNEHTFTGCNNLSFGEIGAGKRLCMFTAFQKKLLPWRHEAGSLSIALYATQQWCGVAVLRCLTTFIRRWTLFCSIFLFLDETRCQRLLKTFRA